jgi:hypothetical protein
VSDETFVVKYQFVIVRALTGLLFANFFFSVWSNHTLLAETSSPSAVSFLTWAAAIGTVAGLAFSIGLATRIAAFLSLILSLGFVSAFLWFASIELIHLQFIILLYILFGRQETWFSPFRFMLSERKIWYLPLFLVFYFGFSISGISKSLYEGWSNGYVVHFLCEAHSPLAEIAGTGACAYLPARISGIVILLCEILSFPLAIFKSTRFFAWILFTGVNLGAYAMIRLAPVTTGMMIVQLFLFDPAWLRQMRWMVKSNAAVR